MKKEKPKLSSNQLLARYIAAHGVRNTEMLESLHSGIFPKSETGDFSDIKVVTPYGEIPWKQLSRISDPEMRELMLGIEQMIAQVLDMRSMIEFSDGSLAETLPFRRSYDDPEVGARLNRETTK